MLKRIPRISRRRFSQGAATGALAWPTIVPRSVFGAEEKPAPSERITVGFIGCGKMANDYHLSTLLKFEDVKDTEANAKWMDYERRDPWQLPN